MHAKVNAPALAGRPSTAADVGKSSQPEQKEPAKQGQAQAGLRRTIMRSVSIAKTDCLANRMAA